MRRIDWLRQMNDAEFATWYDKHACYAVWCHIEEVPQDKDGDCRINCSDCILKWLQEEIGDGE